LSITHLQDPTICYQNIQILDIKKDIKIEKGLKKLTDSYPLNEYESKTFTE